MTSPQPLGGDPLGYLRRELEKLYLRAGKPSLRAITKMSTIPIAHTTVRTVLLCTSLPKWSFLKTVVEALEGDVRQFHTWWMAADPAALGMNGGLMADGPDMAPDKHDSGMTTTIIGGVHRRRVGELHGAGELEAALVELDLAITDLRVDRAEVLGVLGRYEEARSSLEEVTRVLEAHDIAANEPRMIRVVRTLAELLSRDRQALKADEKLRIVRAAQDHGLDDAIDLADTNYTLGILLADKGATTDAEAAMRTVLEVRSRELGPVHPDTLRARHDLARIRLLRGHLDESVSALEAIVLVLEGQPAGDDVAALAVRQSLANGYSLQERYALAEQEYHELLEIGSRIFGAHHRDTLRIQSNLAVVLYKRGSVVAAEDEMRAVFDSQRDNLGLDHPDTLGTLANLANLQALRGQYADAEQVFRSVLADQTRILGADHPSTLGTQHNLAVALWRQGELAEAETLFRSLLQTQEGTLGPADPETLRTRRSLANLLAAAGRVDDARNELDETLAIQLGTLGGKHPDTIATRASVRRFRTSSE